MDLLVKLLSNHARAEIFRLLFNSHKPKFYLRELARNSTLAVGAFQKELSNLKAMDLIKSHKDGNRIIYEANDAHPLFNVICELVAKTSGVKDELKKILTDLIGIEYAFIFSSYAEGKEKSSSDIDLVIIGDISLRAITPTLKKITEVIERDVNPHVYTLKSWKDKLKKEDHFLKSILDSSKIMLIGDEHELS